MSKKNNTELNIKSYLTKAEHAAFIDGVVTNLLREDIVEKWYEYKHRFINEFTLLLYCGIDVDEFDVEPNIYGMIDDIENSINLNQYQDILDAIDEGLQVELSKLNTNSLFADMNQGNNEEAMSQIDAMIEKVGGQEKFNKLLELATQTEIQQKAREEVKLEMINNKANKAK